MPRLVSHLLEPALRALRENIDEVPMNGLVVIPAHIPYLDAVFGSDRGIKLNLPRRLLLSL